MQRLEPLKKRPGEWGQVQVTDRPEQAHSQAGGLRAGRFVVPEGQWEFTARKTENNGGAVYARYLGPKDEQPVTAA